MLTRYNEHALLVRLAGIGHLVIVERGPARLRGRGWGRGRGLLRGRRRSMLRLHHHRSSSTTLRQTLIDVTSNRILPTYYSAPLNCESLPPYRSYIRKTQNLHSHWRASAVFGAQCDTPDSSVVLSRTPPFCAALSFQDQSPPTRSVTVSSRREPLRPSAPGP